jgi:hypothetical protein
MLNPVAIKAEALGRALEDNFRSVFGSEYPQYGGRLNLAAKLVLEMLANCDALYHDIEHTMMVTLVGQEILRGRHIREELTADDWLHFTVATLAHDLGYIRGVCRDDTPTGFVVNDLGDTIEAPRGATDAFLTPYHVDRGKIAVRERLGPVSFIDEERVAKAIELTRFPVPDSSDYQDNTSEAGLVRAADLIGQLADPNYPRKLANLYYEFLETGTAAQLQYNSPADLADSYPEFYWRSVKPYIGPALEYLSLTQEGKSWMASLYAHVFAIEHDLPRFGPQR